MTWFCSWLSDVVADESALSWVARRITCRPRMEESGEKMKIKESEVRCRLRATSHGRHLSKQRHSKQETCKGSLGGEEGPG